MNTTSHHTDPEDSGSSIQRANVRNFEENDTPCCLQPESCADGILILQDGVIRQSNPAMAQMSKYALEEVLDTCVASYFDTSHIEAVESLCEHVLQSLDGPQMLEATLVCKNGRRALTQITALSCTYKQRPACLLTIHHLGFITSLSERISRDCHDLLTGIAAVPSPVPSS